MKNIKGTLPNILTYINLSLGVVAILLAIGEKSRFEGNYNLLVPASLLIMIAALTDRFDGKIARIMDVTSDFGRELDSLSDLISFGVAPVVIAWKLCFADFGVPGYLVALIFPIAGAYRLARFNITAFDNVFRGIPVTIAGAFLTIDNLYNCFVLMRHQYTHWHLVITIILIVVLSLLMVSKIRVRKI